MLLKTLVLMLILFWSGEALATVTLTTPGGGTGDVTINLPSGSTGRRVSLYNTNGEEAYNVTSGDTSATITTPTAGTYFWRVTGTDGATFLDNSDWITVARGDVWAWADANLTCRSDVALPASPNCTASWTMEERGGAGAYYVAFKKNATSDYAYQTLPLGSNLTTGKTITTSSSGGTIGTNMGFETGTASSWSAMYGTCGSGCTVANTKASEGTYSHEFTSPTSTQVRFQTISVTANMYYSLQASFWPGMSNVDMRADVRSSDDTQSLCTIISAVNSQAWGTKTCNINTGANTSVLVRIYVAANGSTTGSGWVDDVRLCLGAGGCSPTGATLNDADHTTRWFTTTAVPQWVKIDMGVSPPTYNMVRLVTTPEGDRGYRNHIISGSNDDISYTTIYTGSGYAGRLKSDPSLWIDFAPQTYRYLKIEATSVFTQAELSEVEVYNVAGTSGLGDIAEISVNSDASWWKGFNFSNVTYSSKAVNQDGSTTYSKGLSLSGTDTLTLDTTYKKLSENAWEKSVKLTSNFNGQLAIRNTIVRDSANIRHRVHSNGAQAMDTKDYTLDDGTYSGLPQVFQMATWCDPQCFGIVADDGYSAKWHAINGTTPPAGIKESLEVSATKKYGFANWGGAYAQYGKEASTGVRYINVTSGTPLTLDFFYFFSDDPAYKRTAELSYIAMADGKGFSHLNNLDKLFVGAAYQLARIRSTDQQTTQWLVAAPGYAYDGEHNDSILIAMGLGDKGTAERLYEQFRKSVTKQPITYDDPLNKVSSDLAWFMALTYSKYLKSKFNTAVDLVEVRSRADAYIAAVDANGESLNLDYADDTWISDLMTADMWVRGQMETILELRAAKALLPTCGTAPCWAASEETKLQNAITALRSLYDPTNKYIKAAKYGHWARALNGSFSGGAQYYSQDYAYSQEGMTGATMRFVAPATGTLTLYTSKNSTYGNMVVKLNGTPVAGSPFDLYNATVLFQQSITAFAVVAGDVITFSVANSKNVDSTGYRVSIDRLTIGANTYEENDANWQCGSIVDCTEGRTKGWATWKDQNWLWLYELIYRNVFGEQLFLNSQLIDHFENLAIPDLSNGSIMGYNSMGNNDYIPGEYYITSSPYYSTRGKYHRGGDGALFALSAYRLLEDYLGGETFGISYRFQEDSSLLTYNGTWTKSAHVYSANNQDTNYPDGDQYKYSTTAGNYVELSFKGTDVLWYATKGSGYGTANVYIDGVLDTSGISLANASTTYKNLIYSKTGLAYGDHKIKVEVATAGNVNVDVFKVKTRPSWLSSLRKALETKVRAVSHEYICTESELTCYGDSDTSARRDSNGWNNYYRGGLLTNAFPKARFFFEGIYIRR